ncbi:MAG: hypothetical protein JW900_06420 [Anaerolineae bacterium]|nr:hypothetical protein [Anaerolineae bacterium]
MNGNRERLAWFILIVSFVLCIGLAVGLPLGGRHLVLTACIDQKTLLEPQQGTPRLQLRGRGQVFALTGPSWDVPAGTAVTTDHSAQSLLTLYTLDGELAAVATVQMYGDTEIVLLSARSPRFAVSPLPHRVVLELQVPPSPVEAQPAEGRVRITVSSAAGRDTEVELRTAHMTALLSSGSYEARVRAGSSELTVRGDGSAEVTAVDGETITLGASQRAIVQPGADGVSVTPAERNLLVNGNFARPLEAGWQSYHDEQQAPSGSIELVDVAGRRAARLYRDGIGHAEVGLVQEINYDVRDFSSLIFAFSVQVQGQSLPGCGSLGSECPIIVRIDYKDIYGTDRQWYYGFYSVDHVPTDVLQPWEQQVPLQTWVPFDSGNLIEVFEQPPAVIQGVTIYASGHAFDALVTDVELLAQE